MTQNSTINKLNEFLVKNRELDLLEADLREFNPLKILKVEHFEIRHSNVLAWLCDPRENHGLGDIFLKKLLGKVLIENERIRFPITVAEILNANFHDAQVLREFGYTDILISSKSNNIGFLIENKIHAREHEGQVARYIKMLKKEFPSMEIIPVLLTLDDLEEDGERDYSGINYDQIYDLLMHLMELYGKGLNPRVADFIKAYLETLEVLTMQENNEVVRLCKEIYRRHKDAVDAIIEYGIWTSHDEAIDEFRKGKSIEEICRSNRWFWFLPEVLLKRMPKFDLGWKSPYPISFWFRFSRHNKIGLILEVGPFNDFEKRLSFIKEITNSSYFKVAKKAFRPESKYTRIYSKYQKYDEWDDTEQLIATMNQLYADAKEAEKSIIQVVSKFHW